MPGLDVNKILGVRLASKEPKLVTTAILEIHADEQRIEELGNYADDGTPSHDTLEIGLSDAVELSPSCLTQSFSIPLASQAL